MHRGDCRTDTRAFWTYTLQTLSAGRLVGVAYPRFLALHTLMEQLPELQVIVGKKGEL